MSESLQCSPTVVGQAASEPSLVDNLQTTVKGLKNLPVSILGSDSNLDSVGERIQDIEDGQIRISRSESTQKFGRLLGLSFAAEAVDQSDRRRKA